MTAIQNAMDDRRNVTVRVPISIKRRGGRKLILTPNGQNLKGGSASRHIDSAMIKAVARAFRWREMLENGEYSTIREIAEAEKINESYVSRVLRLTLLAPATVEVILDGRQGPEVTLGALMKPFPVEWAAQRSQTGDVR